MTDITIADLVVPASAGGADAVEFRTMVELGNRMAQIDAGIDDLDETAEELLPSWLDQTDRTRRGFVARRGGEIVGTAEITTSNAAGTTSAELGFMIPPPAVAGGTGQALLDRIEREARNLGRSALQTWTLHPAEVADSALIPATGWGSVAVTPLSNLLLSNGYVLEQVERNSVLPLDRPLDETEARFAAASAYAGDDYRVVSWTLPTPPELRTGYGSMIARMVTDIPSGDLVMEAEPWDDDKVVRRDAQFAAGGQTMSVAAVIHEPTGEMVAFNELVIGADRAGVSHQWGTLVAKEHRGKRLGTIVKCANLLRWQQIAPLSPKISTFNAEENRPMLDINEAIGFAAASYAGGWQKKLD